MIVLVFYYHQISALRILLNLVKICNFGTAIIFYLTKPKCRACHLRTFVFLLSPSISLSFNQNGPLTISQTDSVPYCFLAITQNLCPAGIPAFSFTIYSLRNSGLMYLLLDLCQYQYLSQSCPYSRVKNLIQSHVIILWNLALSFWTRSIFHLST